MYKMSGSTVLSATVAPVQGQTFESKPQTDPSITPVQQMVSSCTGALATSLFGRCGLTLTTSKVILVLVLTTVTPLDVVKIRLQSQQKEFMKNKCYLYCNGLMEHICYCPASNVDSPQSPAKPGHTFGSVRSVLDRNPMFEKNRHFNGTLVSMTRCRPLSSA